MKKLNRGEKLILILTLGYISAFTIYFINIKDYEFLWYIAVILFFFGLILFTLHRSRFDYLILGGLSLWGLLHLAGGGIPVQGEVLYALQLIPLWEIGDVVILKYDQLVHFFGFGIATLIVYHLLHPYLNTNTNWKVVFPILVMGGMGLGGLNEVVEFIAVLSFPETGVGGYFNTALDLVFNLLGTIATVVFIHLTKYKRRV